MFSGILILLLSFFLGASIGSFSLVVITRYAHGQSFLVGRSHCEACHHILSWNDLIPVVSYLLLRGKCRYCHHRLARTYWFFECMIGILFCMPLFLLNFSSLSDILVLLGVWGLLTCTVIIFFSDLWYGIIPDFATVGIGCIGLISAWFFSHTFTINVTTGIITGLFFLFLFGITRGKGMGLGDVKYAVAMGMLLGWQKTLVGLYIAFVTGACVALVLLFLRKKKLHGSTIPFGPFLIIGTLASLIIGEVLWKWYIHFL